MEEEKLNLNILPIIIFIVVIALFCVIAYNIYQNQLIVTKLNQLGQQCLLDKENKTSVIGGFTARATFIEEDYKSIAIVKYKNKKVVIEDINYSKKIGKFSGKVGKELLKGVVDGVLEK